MISIRRASKRIDRAHRPSQYKLLNIAPTPPYVRDARGGAWPRAHRVRSSDAGRPARAGTCCAPLRTLVPAGSILYAALRQRLHCYAYATGRELGRSCRLAMPSSCHETPHRTLAAHTHTHTTVRTRRPRPPSKGVVVRAALAALTSRRRPACRHTDRSPHPVGTGVWC